MTDDHPDTQQADRLRTRYFSLSITSSGPMEEVTAEVERLTKANEMMEAVIEDLYGKHGAGTKTCGRVQCKNAMSHAEHRNRVLEAKVASLDGWESLAKYIAGGNDE